MVRNALAAVAIGMLLLAPARVDAQRGVVQSAPPRGADTLQHICRGAAVPSGWIVTDDIRDPQLCDGQNAANLNAYNVWVIRRLDTRAGAVMDVCASTPMPAGWVLIDIFRSKDVCGHPENPFIPNVKRIRRSG